MKEYQAAMLFVYPKLERLIEDIGQMIEAKAVASCLGRERPEDCIETILRYMRARDCFTVCKAAVDEMLAELDRSEQYLLEYKYFRRRKRLEEYADVDLSCCERSYYRLQQRLEAKLNAWFMRAGYSEQWFMRLFSDLPYMMHVLENVRRGGGELVDSRHSRALRIVGEKRAG